MPPTNTKPEPLTLAGIAAKMVARPLFLRRVSRPTPWKNALQSGQISEVRNYLHEGDGKVSLWQVQNDLDLRRVAIAVNESRQSFTEKIEFLPIVPAELETAGVKYEQTVGNTECPAAAQLHYDAEIDEKACLRIINMLLKAGRELARCTSGQMAKAFRDGEADGCFAVSETSTSCKCGENPPKKFTTL